MHVLERVVLEQNKTLGHVNMFVGSGLAICWGRRSRYNVCSGPISGVDAVHETAAPRDGVNNRWVTPKFCTRRSTALGIFPVTSYSCVKCLVVSDLCALFNQTQADTQRVAASAGDRVQFTELETKQGTVHASSLQAGRLSM